MTKQVDLWIVGKTDPEEHEKWEFQGVFDDIIKAVGACVDKTYFIGPAILNQSIPHESVEWIGAYYPKAEAKPVSCPICE